MEESKPTKELKIETLSDLDALISHEFQSEKFSALDTINGIQVSHKEKKIKKVACAVDASIETIDLAVQERVDVLLVHHGLFWGKPLAIREAHYEKVSALIHSDLALYALHLPLDAHPELGNNAQIAKRIGLELREPFGSIQGVPIGIMGVYSKEKSFDEIYEDLYRTDSYGKSSITIISKSKKNSQQRIQHDSIAYFNTKTPVRRVAIVSGGGTRQLEEATQVGADLFITGDAHHVAKLEAEERGISIIFGGHYYTEIWGPLALGQYLHTHSDLECIFIDNPTGL